MPAPDMAALSESAMKICLATPDFVGPIRNGGVGTALLGLAEALRDEADIAVTVLYLNDHYQHGDEDHWARHYHDAGITFTQLPRLTESVQFPPFDGCEYDAVRSFRLYRYLRENRFDILHVPDYLGLGYHTVMTKRLGLDFHDMAIVVGAHGPVAWSRLYGHATHDGLRPVLSQIMERYVVEHADALISPSAFMLDWLKAHGWRLPEDSRHAVNALPRSTTSAPRAAPRADEGGGGPGRFEEIVFFGRIEQRKGISLFLDAIGRLGEALQGVKITFLGSFNESSVSRDLFAHRMMHLDVAWEVIDHFDADAAQRYLLEGNRLAVIPSLMDNSPCTIAECLHKGIRFIATDVGGIGELVEDKDILCAADAQSLADRLERALEQGVPPGRPVTREAEARKRLVDLHRRLHLSRTGMFRADTAAPQPPPSRCDAPFVSVCLVHRDRPRYLAQALDGFRAQTFRDFEVLIADNGSTRPETAAFLAELEARGTATHGFPIRVLRLEANRFPAGARNLLAAAARGHVLKFHDDDNVSKPHELECLVRALRHGAELVTCSLDVFTGDDAPDAARAPDGTLIFLGDGGGLSYLANVMGDSNFAVRADVFARLGGFDDFGFLYHAEDWRLLCKAKALGVRMATIAEPLVWYRAEAPSGTPNWRKKDVAGARFRAVEALSRDLPEEVRHLLLYLSGTWQRT